MQDSLRSGKVWKPAGEGWETLSAEIKLSGWSISRRCVLVRESPAKAPVEKQARRRKNYHPETLGKGVGWDPVPTPWSGKIAVLVTNLDTTNWPDITLAGLYRDRADAENIFDETKNQWGWCGFTTRRMGPTRIMATFIAIVYNLWRLYVRYYDGEHNREAVVTRPALMQGVGRQVSSGGQKRIKISIMHNQAGVIMKAISAVSNELSRFKAAAQQWTSTNRWLLVLVRLHVKYLGKIRPEGFLREAELLLGG